MASTDVQKRVTLYTSSFCHPQETKSWHSPPFLRREVLAPDTGHRASGYIWPWRCYLEDHGPHDLEDTVGL